MLHGSAGFMGSMSVPWFKSLLVLTAAGSPDWWEVFESGRVFLLGFSMNLSLPESPQFTDDLPADPAVPVPPHPATQTTTGRVWKSHKNQLRAKGKPIFACFGLS